METYIELLRRLIAVPSFSRSEAGAADLLAAFLADRGVEGARRKGNNVWAFNRRHDPAKPVVLLNSHHDTVKPSAAYTRDPFSPDIEDGKLYGLGSNDAGASVVALTAAFLHFYDAADLRVDLCLALTAEEEVSGRGGVESVLPELGKLSCAVVGEPTGLRMAVAERGLMVLDCVARGRAGHAARNEGDNAVYKAVKDIEWFRDYRFPRESPLLGPVRMSVTVVNAGSQHNVVPAECRFTVDVRVPDCYANDEVLAVVRAAVDSEVTPRSTRLGSSRIDPSHPLVQAGRALGLESYGSPTASDRALLPVPALKIGPGDPARSHAADEFVRLDEIEAGVRLYIALLDAVCR